MAQAFVSGAAGRIVLSPNTATMSLNTDTSIDINFNTATIAVSSVAIRLKIPVASGDIQIVSVQPNTALPNWTFPINAQSTENGNLIVDLVGLNTGLTGYANNADTKFATVKIKAVSAFTGKAITFDTALTKIITKADASDIAGTLTGGTYTASSGGGGTTITPTPTATPTPTPTPTPVQGGTSNTTPTCTSLSANPNSGTSRPLSVTLTCSGVDADGDITAAAFDFGDGSGDTIVKNVGSPGSITTTHIYNQIGSVAATCVVQDNNQVWSQANTACRQVISINPKSGGGSTYVPPARGPVATATPTPIAMAPIDETTLTPTPEEIPLPTETPEPVVEPTSTPWWMIGLGGALILGIIIFLATRKKGPPKQPPWMSQMPSQQQQYPYPTNPTTPVNQPATTPSEPVGMTNQPSTEAPSMGNIAPAEPYVAPEVPMPPSQG